MPSCRTSAAIALAAAVCLLSACGGSDTADVEPLGSAGGPPAQFTVRVVATHPHDEGAFTQGLVWAGDDELFESTGRKGQSSVRRVAIASGEVLASHEVADDYFAEGLARVDDRLVQLTWQEETAFVYDEASLEQTGSFGYSGEGWGLCYDGDRLVMSSGSSALTFRDPSTFEQTGEVRVTLDRAPLSDLNELECVGDRVYANVFGDDHVYEIDPSTGAVTAVIDASSLDAEHDPARGEVLNGIAYAPTTGHFYLTGKYWPTLYEVTFEPVG